MRFTEILLGITTENHQQNIQFFDTLNIPNTVCETE